jgi:hypothetical protein
MEDFHELMFKILRKALKIVEMKENCRHKFMKIYPK